jgi:BMFP domain-containing protein YqiC
MTQVDLNVAAELAQLRGEMSTGFAQIVGRLDLIAHTTDSTRADVDELEARVAALEARRIPLGVLASVSGAVSAAVAAVAFLVQL